MRQFKALSAAAVLIITFLLSSVSAVSGLNERTFKIFVDSSGVFVCESGDYSVTVRNLNNSTQYKYTYKNKVLSYCVTGGKLYTLNSTTQSKVVMINVAKNGKFTKSFVIKTKNVPYNTQLCVDGAGAIYIFDNTYHTEVYNANGQYIKTTSNKYNSLIQVNGKVLASNISGIYRLNGKTEKAICNCKADTAIYAVSKDCAATLYGSIYNINTGKKVLDTDCDKPYSTTLTSKRLFVIKGKTVLAYKKNKNLISSRSLNYKPFAVCSVGSNVFTIGESADGFTVKKYKESSFLSSGSTNNPPKSKNPTGISFGGYKLRGKYIFLPPRLTKAEFKEKISYKDYKLKFSSTRGLGTNTKAVFTKDGKSYTYTVVVIGDITGTGRITKNDVNIMFNCLFGLDKVGGVYKIAADANGDGKLSDIDLVMISRKKDN